MKIILQRRALESLTLAVLTLFPGSVFCQGTGNAPADQGLQPAPQNSPTTNTAGNVAVPGRGGVGFPSCISCPEPHYTDGARNRHVSGTVRLEVLIQSDGRATNIQVTQTLDPDLDKQAVKAAQDWRFKPALGPDGKPVSTRTIIEITFRLLDDPVFARESNDYDAFYRAHTRDPKQGIPIGEAFLKKYPASSFKGNVYAALVSDYLTTNQFDKMLDAGEKALAMGTDNVDVLPVLAWAVARRSSSAADLEKALDYGKRGIAALEGSRKPSQFNEATFDRVRNSRLAQCHSGMGAALVKLKRYEEGIAELSQAIQLDETPDLTDLYLLGIAQRATNRFTDAIISFTKCATEGPLQTQCQANLDEAKKQAATSLENPN